MSSEQDGTHVENPAPDEEEEWSGPDFTMPSWYGQSAGRSSAGSLPAPTGDPMPGPPPPGPYVAPVAPEEAAAAEYADGPAPTPATPTTDHQNPDIPQQSGTPGAGPGGAGGGLSWTPPNDAAPAGGAAQSEEASAYGDDGHANQYDRHYDADAAPTRLLPQITDDMPPPAGYQGGPAQPAAPAAESAGPVIPPRPTTPPVIPPQPT
ncbi:MAG: hypothetical protein HOV68_09355, partial [Streptomycetaceae bacterium]|nr:hypothetical protein [Streptomycetaceae bacterium]